jgi:RNA polymerase sigma factor (sigma-70 family)
VQEDSLWLEQLRRGDREALCRIYMKYRDDLVRVAGCLLADFGSVEDCLQDVFVSLASRASPPDLRGSLKSYLVSCVVYRVRAELQRRRNDPRVSADEIRDPRPGPAEAVQIVMHREQAAELHEALGRLSYEQREVITMHLHGQMTFQQIAEELEISINTVQSRYRYGLDKLRLMLNAGVQPWNT